MGTYAFLTYILLSLNFAMLIKTLVFNCYKVCHQVAISGLFKRSSNVEWGVISNVLQLQSCTSVYNVKLFLTYLYGGF